VTSPWPGYDQVAVAAPGGGRLCSSLACARAGRAAVVIAGYGALSDPDAGSCDRAALWRECRGQSYPLCGACREQDRQVMVRYRPGLVGINATGRPVAAQSSGAGHDRPARPGPRRPAPAVDEDAWCWREAARLRGEHRGWVVIWLPAAREFRACGRLPGARRDTVLTAATPARLAALIGQAEQAAGITATTDPEDHPR
jgi:hypothetical protein